MNVLTVSEARAILPEVLDRVARGEEITITRHGRAAAVLLRPDRVRSRRAEPTIAQAREIGDLLVRAREQPLSDDAAMSVERADELVASVCEDRDGR